MFCNDAAHRAGEARSMALFKLVSAAILALGLGACTAMKLPDKLYTTEDEVAAWKIDIEEETKQLAKLKDAPARHKRNEIVSARKYAIDLEYTKYEAALIRDSQLTDFSAKAASLALRTTADLVPVGHTSRMLGSIGTGVGGLNDAYDAEVLRTMLLENIQSSMRTARHERAAVIFNHMRCSIKTYTLAMALSDLESYYRAGTFSAGVLTLKQTVQEKEKNTGAEADAQKGGLSGEAKLAAIAAEALVKAKAAQTPGAASVLGPQGLVKKPAKESHKCTPADE